MRQNTEEEQATTADAAGEVAAAEDSDWVRDKASEKQEFWIRTELGLFSNTNITDNSAAVRVFEYPCASWHMDSACNVFSNIVIPKDTI